MGSSGIQWGPIRKRTRQRANAWGAGNPLLENKEVSWFLHFRLVVFGSWFYGFMVLWLYVFDGFLVPKMYEMFISCFQEDMDRISKSFKILFNGCSSFVGARLFATCQHVGVPDFEISTNNIFNI